VRRWGAWIGGGGSADARGGGLERWSSRKREGKPKIDFLDS
jgi:hypothetical protein